MEFSPVLPILNHLRRIFLLVPEHTHSIPSQHDKLVSAIWVTEPPAEMFFLSKVIEVRCLVLVVDASFSSITFDVCKLVYGEGVPSVYGGAM